MPARIGFHGAARTVTGSRHLIETNGKRILVDCGLFQGPRQLRDLNWLHFPVPPHEVDAVVLTHAHTDHIGYLPKLVAEGFRGPVYATKATLGLCRISLPDSGRLQEEEARHANKHGSRHRPALPLYTEDDAYRALKLIQPRGYREHFDLPGRAVARYFPAGHILGSAFAEITFDNGERILMGGDLGRFDTPIIRDPEMIDYAEYLVVESTYGDRDHPEEDVLAVLEEVFHQAYRNGSVLIVPSFAIGRTQELMYHLRILELQDRLPRIPIHLDSPMAVTTTHLYASSAEEFDEDMKVAIAEGTDPLEPEHVELVRDREASKALNKRGGPMAIVAGSGMASGGRVVHHLRQRVGDPNTMLLFTGYQAEGTLGRELLEGQPVVRILGEEVVPRAQVRRLYSLSAHADRTEIMKWLGGFKQPPRRTFVVHGEPAAQDALAEKIRRELGWEVAVPEMGDTFPL
jgi:metallo-beta-lactamase family protein